MIDFSIERELPGGITFEASYVGRRGRKLPILRDYAMPADLCDPQSHTCALDAARQLVGLQPTALPWQTLGRYRSGRICSPISVLAVRTVVVWAGKC